MKNPIQQSIALFFLYLLESSSFLIPSKKQAATSVVSLRGEASTENQHATASEKFNARWNAMFERLKEYKEEYGDCLVPQGYKEDPKLGRWVGTQRRISTVDDKMKEERRDKLNSIGFVWSVRNAGWSPKLEKMWKDRFDRLVQYKQEHGDCLVPQHYTQYKNDTLLPPLGTWVLRQRLLGASNKLRPDRRAKLESVGFVWVAGESLTEYEEQWEEMFAKLEEYIRQHGDCLVPKEYKDDPSLGKWVSNTRHRRDGLDSERISRLESVGFVWDAFDKQWEEMFVKLKEYNRQHGDCLVPKYYKEDPSLGMWVDNVRQRRDDVDSERISKLDSIGFVWNAFDHQWEEMFAKLEEYCRENGDCLVPRGYKEDPALGDWVSSQRSRRERLGSERIVRLNSIGFVWDAFDQQWDEMFAKLNQFRQLHGDCRVPIEYNDDPSLGMWVSNMRFRRDKLDSARTSRLESIGFVWKPFDQQWEDKFARLEDYRQVYGDCLVPFNYKEDPPLGKWVARQRFHRDELDPSRRERLESIGFVWQARGGPRVSRSIS